MIISKYDDCYIKDIMSNLISNGSTYKTYQELLQAQRGKTSRLFNGWTKAGQCEMVAKEIFERLGEPYIDKAGKDLLLEVLEIEILPKIDRKCRAQISQILNQMLPEVEKKCREKILSQKHGDLEKFFGMWGLAAILVQFPADGEEKNNLIEQLHTLFFEKLKNCKENQEYSYVLRDIPKNEILDFVSLLNRTNIPVDDVYRYICRLRKMVERVPAGVSRISELSKMLPAKTAALLKILDLSDNAVPDLLEFIKNVPTKERKEILIDQFRTLFVDKLKGDSYRISSCIENLKGIPGDEIVGFVTLLNCTNDFDYGFSYNISELKEILKGKPDTARLISEVLKLVPAKVDALIKILKLPNAVDAVPSLLEILKKIPAREQRETLIDQIHTLFMPSSTLVELPSLFEYLSSFKIIPENERSYFISHLNELLLSDKSYTATKFDDYIEFLKSCPAEEREVIVNQAKRFLANLDHHGSNHTPYTALTFVRAIPKEERNAFIDQIPSLLGDLPSLWRNESSLLYLFFFPNEGDRINQARNLHLYDLPILNQATLIIQARRLYAGHHPLVGNPLDAVVLLKEKIPENKRENFIDQIPSLVEEVNRLNGFANDIKLQVLLFIFQRMANVERSDFVQHLCNLRIPHIQNHLESLLALPADERADLVEAINLQYELEGAQAELMMLGVRTLIVDPADFSNDEAGNPTRPLLQLFAEIDQNRRFPRINYQNSRGSDQGGLTRDFVAKIFQALCHPNQQRLPLRAVDDRYLPKVEVTLPKTLSLDDQIKCYKAIGMIFGRVLNGDPSLNKGSVTTGTHFHSHVFTMMHALTLDEMNLIPDFLADDSIPEIKLKLTKLYLKTQFPEIFKPDSDLEIADLINGRVSQRLQEGGIEADFLQGYDVNSIIQATLVIAKSMHKTLALPDKWDEIKGNASDVLRKKIEGTLSQDQVIEAFGLRNEPEDTLKGMVKRWISEANPEELRNFIYSLTGSTTLSHAQALKVELREVNPANAPVFHTCGQYMDLPRYATYEIFKQKLGISIANAIAGGFEIA